MYKCTQCELFIYCTCRLYTHTCLCVHTYTRTRTRAHTHTHTHAHIQAWKMSCSDLFSHLLCNIIHVCTHIHTHTRTCIYIYMYTQSFIHLYVNITCCIYVKRFVYYTGKLKHQKFLKIFWQHLSHTARQPLTTQGVDSAALGREFFQISYTSGGAVRCLWGFNSYHFLGESF